jgi:hypothetical protein
VTEPEIKPEPEPPDCAECVALMHVINLALWFALNCADDLRLVTPPSSDCDRATN